MIEIKNLDFWIGDKKILENIELTIEKGEIFGIIGPNGSGKTTLLRHIYGDIKNKNVVVDNKNMTDYQPRELAKKIAVLVQENNLNTLEMTVEDFCMTGRYPYQELFKNYGRKDYEIVDKTIEKLGIEQLRDKTVNQLSGGEKQRVSIARAFIQETEYIVLDEPTNHLDIKYKLELMNQLKNSKKSIIITLHDMNVAMKYCDRIAILRDGKIEKIGKTFEVMNEEILRDIFEIEIKIKNIDGERVIIY